MNWCLTWMALLCMTVKRSKEALMSMALACKSLFMKSTKGSCITPRSLVQRVANSSGLKQCNKRQQAHGAKQWQLGIITHGSSAVCQWSLHLFDNCLACNLATQPYTMQQLQVGTVF